VDTETNAPHYVTYFVGMVLLVLDLLEHLNKLYDLYKGFRCILAQGTANDPGNMEMGKM
jgi:hypothetical protein